MSFVGRPFPRSIYILDLLVSILFSGGARCAARLWHEFRRAQSAQGRERGLLVYGAGVAGLALAREIRSNPMLGYRVLGFLDDDVRKRGAQLLGLPVLGSGEEADKIVKRYQDHRPPAQEIVVAMPSASGREIRAAEARGSRSGVPCRIVPGLGELIGGKLHVTKHREISVTDLLGREPVLLDMDEARQAFAGRTALVTGAAGSIGSELCHQLSQLGPRELVALDQAESELFHLESELHGRWPSLRLSAEIGDIRDESRMVEIIENHGVDAIFHAAAYKHVPVMERQVCEATRNNVIGTWNLAQAAWRSNVSSFLMISTDKAVNPTSIMGLTKRVAELLVTASRSSAGRCTATKFVCVRFGNVLVSNGSVVPIFRKQIAAGGPVTVTHPDMRRYFMTVDEAVQLVLQASIIGKGSEIFLLDMGNPVRIVDLARKMIALAGLVPDEDIEIRTVGVRPGEKLFEELSRDGENVVPTSHAKIRIFKGRQEELGELLPWVSELERLLRQRDAEAVTAHLSSLVPEYQPLGGVTSVVAQRAARSAVAPAASPAYSD
jgi:FlaA1/EpsC-like NDP-sugar epimerase